MIKILQISIILNFLIIITQNQSETTTNSIYELTTTTNFIEYEYEAAPTDPLNSIKYVIDDDIITNITVNINIIIINNIGKL
jgi:hypothetical protein